MHRRRFILQMQLAVDKFEKKIPLHTRVNESSERAPLCVTSPTKVDTNLHVTGGAWSLFDKKKKIIKEVVTVSRTKESAGF